eukprot:PhF_6_TR7341/c0_g1_i1/m.11032
MSLDAFLQAEEHYFQYMSVIKRDIYDHLQSNDSLRLQYLGPLFGDYTSLIDLAEKTRTAATPDAAIEIVLENVQLFENYATSFTTVALPLLWSNPHNLETFLSQHAVMTPTLTNPVIGLPYNALLSHVPKSMRDLALALSAPAGRLSWYGHSARVSHHPRFNDFHIVNYRVAGALRGALRKLRTDAIAAKIENYASALPRNENREILFDATVWKSSLRGRRRRQVFVCSDIMFYCEGTSTGHKAKDYVLLTSALKLTELPDNIPRQHFNVLCVESGKKSFTFFFDSIHERDHFAALAGDTVRASGTADQDGSSTFNATVWPCVVKASLLAQQSQQLKIANSRTQTPLVFSEPATPTGSTHTQSTRAVTTGGLTPVSVRYSDPLPTLTRAATFTHHQTHSRTASGLSATNSTDTEVDVDIAPSRLSYSSAYGGGGGATTSVGGQGQDPVTPSGALGQSPREMQDGLSPIETSIAEDGKLLR